MLKKSIFGLVATAFVSLLVMSLPGCGGGGGGGAAAGGAAAGGGGVPAISLYVSALYGNDAASGTQATPLKSLTKALGMVGAASGVVNIYAASGIYGVNSIETAPIMMRNNVNLIGATASGVANSQIQVSGGYVTQANAYNSCGAGIVFPPGVTASVSGFWMGAACDQVVMVDSTAASATYATMTLNYIDGLSGWSDGVWVEPNAHVTLTSNTVVGDVWNMAGLYVRGHATITARGNTFTNAGSQTAILLAAEAYTAASSPVADFGTSGNGLNVINGNAGNVGLQVVSSVNVTNASGNTWHANKQCADGSGHCVAQLATYASASAVIAGNNYAITNAGAGIQF